MERYLVTIENGQQFTIREDLLWEFVKGGLIDHKLYSSVSIQRIDSAESEPNFKESFHVVEAAFFRVFNI